MKKILIIVTILLATLSVKAQQNEIIYLDFEPDSLVELKQHNLYPESQMKIDFDFDGLPDIRIYGEADSGGDWYYIKSYEPEWEIHEYEVGDTLGYMNDENLWWSRGIMWRPYFYNEIDTMSEKFSIRHRIGGVYFYGWFRVYLTSCLPSPYPWVALDKIAYCNVSDYPLKWGQISLTGIEENEYDQAFITIHPNPTTGLVTVTGENLRQAEVFNMLGQQMLNARGKGNELYIDMTTLPAGIYFVTVTDKEGRKCVRKVLKE